MNRLKKTLAALAIATMPMLYAGKATAQTAPTIDIVTPVAASLDGGNGSKWRTDVGVFNMNDKPAVIDVFYAENGLPASPSATVTVPANGSVTLNDIVNAKFNRPGTAGVTAWDVRDASLAPKVFLTSEVYNLQSDGGVAGSTFPGVPVTNLFAPGSTSYAPTTADSLGNRDNIGFAAGANGATVTAKLRNQYGEIKATKTQTLSPFTRTQTSIAGFFGHDVSNPILSGVQGGMVETSVDSGSMTWYVSENDNKSNSPTAHHGNNKTQTETWLMGAGKVTGANNTNWTTDVKLHNTSDNPILLSMQFMPPGDNLNNSVGPVINYQILGRQTKSVSDVLKNGFGFDTGNGTIKIVEPSGKLLVDSRTKNTTANGTYGVGFTGQFSDEAATSTTTSNTSLVVPLTQNNTTRTNLGLQNTSPYNAKVTISYFNPDGSKITSIEDTLLPFSPKQYNSPLTPSVENAYAVITSNKEALEAPRTVLANTYKVNSITGQNTNNRGVAITSVKKVTGEEYIAKWLDSLKTQYFYLNNNETYCMLNGCDGIPGIRTALSEQLVKNPGETWTPAQYDAWLLQIADGATSIQNPELYHRQDPFQWNSRGGTSFVLTSSQSNFSLVPGNISNIETQATQTIYGLVRNFLVSYVGAHPEQYGGTSTTGPVMTFNPTFSTSNPN
jgi:hypothetical protein